jgi:subtilisin-like proprotein convertase family protein
MGGTVSNMTLTVRSMSHNRANDIDMLLVGPGGQKVMIFSDAGGANKLNGVTVTLSDAAATALPQTGRIASGTYKPTDYESGEAMAAPAPVGPYVSALSTFNGQSANGTWSLFVVDDRSSNQGSIAGGWSLAITTVSGASAPAAAAVASLPGIGGVTVQSTSAITVTLASIVRDTKGHVVLRVEGLPGRQYLIESSEDLVSWKALGTVGDALGVSAFTDLDAATHHRLFYRAVEVP